MRSFTLRAILSVVLSLGLFIGAVFFAILPALERAILEQKRTMIRELTTSACNILARFENDERSGILTREQAQQQAIQQIRNLHYGRELKDYFWVTDQEPRMVVHPYRRDLEGRCLATFTDPSGKRLFVEMTEVASRTGAGFVDYMWQWHDDATRVVPKLSYVKAFPPWRWIIGTGVYIDDVQSEIAAIRRGLVLISLAVLTLVSILLLYLLTASVRTERRRQVAEEALKQSEERYRLAIQSAGEGIIMALGPTNWHANQVLLQTLGYSLDEFSRLTPEEILVPTEEERAAGRPHYQALLRGDKAPLRYEARLRTRTGSEREVLLSLSPLAMQDRHGFIAVATDIAAQRSKELAQDRLIAELEANLHFLNRTVGEVCDRRMPEFARETAIETVLESLAPTDLEGFAVTPSDGSPAAPATARAVPVTRLQLIEGLAADPDLLRQPVAAIVETTTAAEIADRELVFNAYRWLEDNRYLPLAVRRDDGTLAGFLSSRSIAQIAGFSPTILLRDIAATRTAGDLARSNRRLPQMVRAMVRTGARPEFINDLISENADAILQRAVAFSLDELGPAPAPFAFMVMGSAGRKEQTLCTDQDNAIVFDDVPADRLPAARAWFEQLGARVCDLLAACGFSYCKGDVMAKNPKWVQPMSAWIRQFGDWTSNVAAKDLLHTKIFFDFRGAIDEQGLVPRLHAALWHLIAGEPRFLSILAHNLQQNQPPIGLFGEFVGDPKVTDRQVLDLKVVMAPIVDFARIYALRHQMTATRTADRLDGLVSHNVLTPADRAELGQCYTWLMGMRIQSQIEALDDNRPADNYIEPARLSTIDRRVLREVCERMRLLNNKLGHDFTGNVSSL